MLRRLLQAGLAVAVWLLVLTYAGMPGVLAILIPVDVGLVGLALLCRRSLQT
jgi:hypothetical protein